ncbi:MAG: D-alanyl-D-alanine carboxypeptidase family protein [bacterium]|nr:D-alanyl-D-alanine carboxypeptidase family protein [bacterium]
MLGPAAGVWARPLEGPPPGLAELLPAPRVEAAGAVLAEAVSGQILALQDPDESRPPASLAKLMTLRLAWQALTRGEIEPGELVIVSENAWRTPGSRMFIEVGERVSVADLLRGIAIASGNDAAVALAERLAGTEEAFVARMNAEAARLGLADTRFADSHGLAGTEAGAATTALDVARLAVQYLRDHPQSLELHSTRRVTYGLSPGGIPITQENRNRLLWRYEGVDGLKTGFIAEAGYHLVATAEREGMRLVAVILGAPSEAAREAQAATLLDYGFANFTLLDVGRQLEPHGLARVWRGKENWVRVAPDDITRVTVPRRQAGMVEVDVHPREHLFAPVRRGQAVADAVIRLDGMELRRIVLRAEEDVERGGWWKMATDTLRFFWLRFTRRLEPLPGEGTTPAVAEVAAGRQSGLGRDRHWVTS